MNQEFKAKVSGAQSTDRALGLLRSVALAPGDGVRVSDLAEANGLVRATTHRLLKILEKHRLVEQDLSTKRYVLGLEFFTLAAAASNRYDVADVARAALERLSQETGDTATFCLRSNHDLVCIDVVTGSFPIKALPMDIGAHRPVGAGASGLAFLAAMPDFMVDRMLQENAKRLEAVPGQDASSIAAAIENGRANGYVLAPDDAHGRMLGVSVALMNRQERPEGTLTLTGLPERFLGSRSFEVSACLIREARIVEEAMWRMPDARRHASTWRTGQKASTS